MIRLVILDFDDTLIDNIYLDYQSFVFSCKKLGLQSPSFKKIESLRKQGLLAGEIINEILDNKIENRIFSKFVTIRKDFLKDTSSIRFLKLKDDTEKLLLMLKQQKINCILCTSRKDKHFVIEFLKKQNIYKYFSKIYDSQYLELTLDNVDPLNRLLIKNILIRKILKDYNLRNSEILYVGNALEDQKTAQNMNVLFIYFQNFYLPKYTQVKLKVDNMIGLIKKIESLSKENTLRF